MASAFMWDERIAQAAFVGDLGTAATGALPLSNITDPQPRVRTRWQASSVSVYVDLGSSLDVGVLALIGTNLTAVSAVRWRIGSDAGFGASDYDTGSVFSLATAANNGNVILIHPTDTGTGRYMRVDIDAPELSYIDVGRIVAGPLWRLNYGYAFGAGEGRVMLDRRDRNSFTGAEFPVPAAYNPRAMSFSLPVIRTTEAETEHRSMLATLGAVGDALWIPDDGLSQAELNARCIWGGVNAPGGASLLTRATPVSHSRSFTLVERV